jgi:NADPH-dependent 2,4-dienoyl-CoA reductase/sulfur reductase-like enzyme
VARLVVIGGGAAGMSAASAARRTAPDLEVVVCEAGGFAAYGMCGIPYYLGGVIADPQALLAYPPEEFRDRRGIDLRLRTRVTGIDPSARQIRVSGPQDGPDADGAPLGYDALVLATGADPVLPPVPGLSHPRVVTVRSLDAAIGLRGVLERGQIRRAVVAGAGYIGLEMAEALTERGIETEMIEALPTVLGTVDEPIARLAADEVTRHSGLRLNTRLEAVHGEGDGLTVLAGRTRTRTDLLVVATGVAPATGLLTAAGADHLPGGALVTGPDMATSLPEVFAAGDCAALHHIVLGRPAWVPLGPAANKTGRVAGTVAAGGAAAFGGIAGTAVVKVFDLEVARTGLTLTEARAAGLDAVATDVVSRSRAKYYPGGFPLHVRLVHDRDGRLLGGQLAGREGAATRVDVLAAALHARASVADLAVMDLGYAPPFAPVYDPLLTAAIKAGAPVR